MVALVLIVAVLVVALGLAAADIALQASTIRLQRQANDTLTRAVGRERAAATILRSELEYLSESAQIRNLWVGKNSAARTWLS